jgi:hypothetical protein
MQWNDDLLEKYSSAVTLSDMEIFIYPELMYSLVLANIMSPRIWEWRNHPFFRKMHKMTKYRRVLRLKQFIIDQYEFNLDLETWGLTTQEREVARFRETIDAQTLSESNALFGYEGDKYYFDMDIRRHFGLDKYTGNVIPYWKTETVEAMDAFRFKEGYSQGAGECVSLAALYAAALYVVCEIPLEDIYLLATPLHSQNFIDMKDGILTNNRRIVTKAMWYNGTELTDKAQRALRNERVTIVSHCSGYIHTVYPSATIDPARYAHFSKRLKAFLRTRIDMEIIVNFLRHNHELQRCFQIAQACHGRTRFLPLEVAYQYEHSGPYKLNSATRDKLLNEIDEYKWQLEPVEGRVMLQKLEEFFSSNTIDFEDREGCERLLAKFDCHNDKAPEIMRKLIDFVYVEPRLPECDRFARAPGVYLDPDLTREQVIERVEALREQEPVADLAFYAYRDLARTNWQPFVKAALERNPVCVAALEDKDLAAVVQCLETMPNESIYDEARIAQPDEVWNYGRGDGVERAFCLAAVLKQREPDTAITLEVTPDAVRLESAAVTVGWPSSKGLTQRLTL